MCLLNILFVYDDLFSHRLTLQLIWQQIKFVYSELIILVVYTGSCD